MSSHCHQNHELDVTALLKNLPVILKSKFPTMYSRPSKIGSKLFLVLTSIISFNKLYSPDYTSLFFQRIFHLHLFLFMLWP